MSFTKVLILTNNLYPEMGGPYNVITSTAEQLVKNKNCKIRLVANYDGKNKSKSNIIQLLKHYDIIHYFGGWDYFHIKVFIACLFYKKKYILTPMGIFEPWSLDQKKFKKKLALTFYQKKILDMCDMIHATSEIESNNLKSITKNPNIKIIGHGIDKCIEYSEKKFFTNQKKKAIFFSRLHKKKGIMNLVKVWKKIQAIDWELHIYGPDFDGHKIQINKIKNPTDNIFIHDAIYDYERKNDLFKNFDLFILPSKSENFGYVVLESLSCGLPVLTTNKTPWIDIQKKNSGWIINDSFIELKLVLYEIFNTSKKDFLLKKRNTIKVARNYETRKISRLYLNTYKKILSK